MVFELLILSFVGQVWRFRSLFKRKKEDRASETNFCLLSVSEYIFDALASIFAVMPPKTPIAITVIINSISVNPFEDFFSDLLMFLL